MVTRGEIWLTALDPVVGSEIRKTRPCLVVSPAEMHDHLRTVIVAPMTTKAQPMPFRVRIVFQGATGTILLDQVHTLDKARLLRRLGKASPKTVRDTLAVLQAVFSP